MALPRLEVPQEVVKAYIIAQAVAHGLNPRIVIAIVKSEGGYDVNAHGDLTQGGSYGPFQFNLLSGSMGARFQAEKHLDPSDPKNWQAMVDYAIEYISAHRDVRSIQSQWHGVNNDPHINGPIVTSGVGSPQNVADFLAAVFAGWGNTGDSPGGPDPAPPVNDPIEPVAGECGPIMSVTWGGPGNAVPVPVFNGAALACEIQHSMEALGRELLTKLEDIGSETLLVTLKVLATLVAIALLVLGIAILTNAAQVLNGETEG